uniref:Uncharacterized protein n=1 Tax=Arundo donax TaxID=35708 RepID=A0A0A9HR60_ARUDO
MPHVKLHLKNVQPIAILLHFCCYSAKTFKPSSRRLDNLDASRRDSD